ncbi:MAG TPA: hypothetical protein VNW90_11025 [Acetobacteraceae bacterium]|nr:hypothetical protein [Acetobacteraceae bacterium]
MAKILPLSRAGKSHAEVAQTLGLKLCRIARLLARPDLLAAN